MLPEALSGHGGVRFVAIVFMTQGRYHADCFYEFPPAKAGLGAEAETIHRSEASSLSHATTMITGIAAERGFCPSEIVWS